VFNSKPLPSAAAMAAKEVMQDNTMASKLTDIII
jgi:hypothetical protein